MFHWQILLGLAGGIVGAIWGAGTGGDVFILLAGLAARVIGTCAVFYTLFLCRMLGAGDIKLMALCTGLLGMGPGLLVIFTGLFLAALRAAGMIWQQGSLWMRMERIGTFIIRSGREGKFLEYPGREDKRNILRLGPWLFLGYCIWLAGRYL